MLFRQLLSLGLAMSMHAFECLQLHLTLNGLDEMVIMFLLKFTDRVLGFIIFYYTVRGLCLVLLETVGECSSLLLTIQCFMYYGCLAVWESTRLRLPGKRIKYMLLIVGQCLKSKIMMKVQSLNSAQVKTDLCAVCHAFTLHMHAWWKLKMLCVLDDAVFTMFLPSVLVITWFVRLLRINCPRKI